MKNRPALKILIPYLAGIILADRFADRFDVNLTFLSGIILGIFSAICLLIIFFAYKKRWLSSSSAFLFLCFLIVGFIRYEADMIPPKNLDRVANQNVGVYGTVLNSQKERNGGSSMLINAEAFPTSSPSIRMNGKISIRSWTDDSLPDKYKYGDVIGLYGKITQARKARNPGEFDYRKFLQRQGIFAMMSIDDKFRFSVKQRFQTELDKNKISDELKKEFTNKKITLSQNATVSVNKAGNIWQIKDGQQVYTIKKEEDKLNVYEIARIYDLGFGGQFFMRWVDSLRKRINIVIKELSSDDETETVFKSLILGEGGEVSFDLYEAFRKTGTTHVLVVSGVNFAILAGWVYWLFNALRKTALRTGRWKRFLEKEAITYTSVFIIIIIYALVAGMEFSVLRAFIFITLFILGVLINRDKDLFNILAIAALCILIFIPGAFWSAGFQLSFVAVASITYLMPYWEISLKKVKWFRNIKEQKRHIQALYWIIQGIAVSISAQLGASLIIAYTFRTFWPIGFLVNSLIFPLVFVITPIAFALCFIGLISIPLASLFALLNNFLIGLLVYIVRWFADYSSLLPIGSFSLVYFALIAGTIIFLVNIPRIMRKRYIFSLDLENESYLNLGTIPDIVKYEFRNKKITLSENAKLITQIFGKKWLITDNPSNSWYDKRQAYIVKKNNKIAFYRHNQNLLVYGLALIALFCWGIAFEYDGHVAKITYLDVRQADSFLIQSPDNYNILIDGGSLSERFDNGEQVVAPFLRRNGIG
ncbi:MAG: ComEC/Rec2 family competence protein [Candidatus Poribacteria bacterium]